MSPLEIVADRLRDGHVEEIDCELPPAFLDLREEEVAFPAPVSVRGSVYSTGDHLIFDYDVVTRVQMPCSVCNQLVETELRVEEGQAIEEICHCLSGIWDCREVVRESILLELPPFVECEKGNCPRRAEIEPYLKKVSDSDEEQRYHPFADL
jgi:DUF177 domain-containing protein